MLVLATPFSFLKNEKPSTKHHKHGIIKQVRANANMIPGASYTTVYHLKGE